MASGTIIVGTFVKVKVWPTKKSILTYKEINEMKKIKVLFAIICITLMATMTPLASHADDTAVAIDVSPNVINIGSSSTWVTVHTDIPYDVVKGGTVDLAVFEYNVELGNVELLGVVIIKLYLMDDRGNFVAKFDMDAVKALFETLVTIDDEFTFVMSGETIDQDVDFSGEQDIRVFDNSGQPGKM